MRASGCSDSVKSITFSLLYSIACHADYRLLPRARVLPLLDARLLSVFVATMLHRATWVAPLLPFCPQGIPINQAHQWPWLWMLQIEGHLVSRVQKSRGTTGNQCGVTFSCTDGVLPTQIHARKHSIVEIWSVMDKYSPYFFDVAYVSYFCEKRLLILLQKNTRDVARFSWSFTTSLCFPHIFVVVKDI
jgi:hypothetical protein